MYNGFPTRLLPFRVAAPGNVLSGRQHSVGAALRPAPLTDHMLYLDFGDRADSRVVSTVLGW